LAGFQSSTAGRDGAPSGGAPGPRARPPGSHGSLPGQLRHVARIQQCGVGHAGARVTRTVGKTDDRAWVTDTVRVAGRSARYLLAMMDKLPALTRFRRGTNTLTQASAPLFQEGSTPRLTALATL